ncbi:hypothetical protein B0H13DRAFT_2378851 [Mycena leptocephala]|nr:hypothetical protein B0H13DRAFT_2378851 [Mycena leptocephala]
MASLYISIASALEIVACGASSHRLIPHNPLARLVGFFSSSSPVVRTHCASLCASYHFFLALIFHCGRRVRPAVTRLTLSMRLERCTHELAAGAGGRERGKVARWHPPLYRTRFLRMMCLHLHRIQSACIRIRIRPRLAVPSLSLCFPSEFCSCGYGPGLVFLFIYLAIIRSSSSPLPASHFPRDDDLRVWTCGHPYARRRGTPRDLSSLPCRSLCPARLRVC